jgi:dihydroorotate dehydrogenase electron transfer subunit
MSDPSTPPIHATAVVLQNQLVARDTYLLRLHFPELARRILPGQFVMVRIPGRSDPLLARPFALYDTAEDGPDGAEAIDFIYLVLGAGTRCLRSVPAGGTVDVWGPLGNTFPVPLPRDCQRHLLIVAGGVGQTPFLAVMKALLGIRTYGGQAAPDRACRPQRITFAWGVRESAYFALLHDFEATGSRVLLATNDGSIGRRGYVTELVAELLEDVDPPTAVYACGPEPMLQKVCAATAARRIPTWVSLETKMACGYGVCFSCVAPVREAQDWDYVRVCVNGPVFPAEQVAWSQMAHPC